ncbi:MAG: hypothetical protein LBJ83_02350 [Oscillospiraceae bacterium]|jgi:hypothetical protein|nr:hypothetical protein [Oscillospiraceae bacterium]
MKIDLNFLPFETSAFVVPVFRRKFNGEKREDGYFVAKLPIFENARDNATYDTYRISLSPFEDSSPYSFQANENPRLMKSIIWYQFKYLIFQAIDENKIEADVVDKYDGFVSFVVENFPEGQRVVKASPYYLGITQQYGFLLEFSFRKKHGVPFSKRIQQLSFSIDRVGKSNANSYLDKLNYITAFIRGTFATLAVLDIDGQTYQIQSSFVSLDSQELNGRTYIFGDGHEDYDKIRGIKTHPYAPPPKEPIFVFVFKNTEKTSGNELYRAMTGKGYPATFSGMKEWFNCDINTGNVKSIIVDFDSGDNVSDTLISELKNIVSENPQKQIIGLFIDSYSHINNRSDNYAKAKMAFFSLGIPLQVVLNDRIVASEGLKWAISGIGLQVFSKMGGIPWLVKPSTDNCLIFGIGQAHDKRKNSDGSTTVLKYFAYSVCFDSSGVYRSLGVLCDTDNRKKYYEDLENNIISQIETQINEGKTITDCVIHTPFRMRYDEMMSIKNSIDRLREHHQQVSFTVMRINVKNKFFGFADNNLKVPFESSFVKLSEREYLIWFEGLRHGREYLNKRVANPTYIEFFYGGNESAKAIRLLQDAVNLAGASWRGFNAKLEPISIFYPELIAGFIREFRKLDAGQNIGQTLSQFNTPWFL